MGLEEVTAATFVQVIQSEIPVLLDFWGPQCQACLALMPTVETLAETLAGKVQVTKVNARENPQLCIQLAIMGLPAFLVFKGGKEVGRLTGKMTPQQLQAFVSDAVR